METLKKLGALLALFVALIGTVWTFVCVIKAEDTFVPLIGLIILVCFAIPTAISLFNYLRGVKYVDGFPLEVGDEFETDRGEKFKVIGFDEDGTPKCEPIK